MENNFKLVVRSTEIDGNGHVNNAKYLEYLEWARQEWHKSAGMNRQNLDLLGIKLVTVNVNINYKKEAFEGEVLSIETELEKVGRSSFVLVQKMYNQNKEIVVDASTTRVAIEKSSKKSCPIPEELKANLIEQLANRI